MRIEYDRSEKAKSQGLADREAVVASRENRCPYFLIPTFRSAKQPCRLGAYSLFVIPGKSDWELVVNKDVSAGATRNASQDLARTAMQTGQLQDGEKVATIYLAHIAPTQCNVRIVYGKTMAWGEIHEK